MSNPEKYFEKRISSTLVIGMLSFLKKFGRMEGPRFEYEPLNGRVLCGLIVPDDVIMKIMEYLNGDDILLCRVVCKNWDDFAVKTMQHLYRTRFRKSPENLPFRYVFVRLYRDVFGRNLLKNANGESGFNHWTIISNGGDKFKVERVPQGAPSLPDDVPEFNGHKSCFATSYRACEKGQSIKIVEGSHLDYLLKHKVRVYASEWVCARFDCGAKYHMKLMLRGKDDAVEAVARHAEEQWNNPPWKKVELEIDTYPENITRIDFVHCGKDTQFWAGHYGMKMAGAVVKLLPID